MAAVADQPHPAGTSHPQYAGETVNLHVSKFLLGSLLAAVGATVAVVAVWASKQAPPPRLGGPQGPPPDAPTDLLLVTVGVFVIAWVAVIIAVGRDQVLRRLAAMPSRREVDAVTQGAVQSVLGSLRERLNQDWRADMAATEGRLASLTKDFGEQRETDGFLRGMRTAASSESGTGGEVRTLHSVPPPAPT